MIAIIDYGMGNLGSIANMLHRLRIPACVTSNPTELLAASKLILPGVGAFDAGMQSLAARGLIDPLREKVLTRKTPLLGLCLGHQMLGRRSEEGREAGLGWIEAESRRLRPPPGEPGLKVPHMGWNHVRPVRPHPLFENLGPEPKFYFVHSYHLVCEAPDLPLALTAHGDSFVSAVSRGNIAGVQFHPEKSHRYGMTLLRNFAERVE